MRNNISIIKIIMLISLVSISTCLLAQQTIKLQPSLCNTPGRHLQAGELATPADVAKDIYCSNKIIEKYAPNGVVAVFGGSLIKPETKAYKDTLRFSYLWTKAMGNKYPILTGGGPGIMHAANIGAKKAGGHSLSFAAYGGKGNVRVNPHVTAYYLFSSFAQRESSLIDHARAVIIAPGGFGTEWEIFETLSKIQTKNKQHCVLILLGSKAQWQTLLDRVNHFETINTIRPEHKKLVHIASTPEQAINIIKQSLTN